MCDATDLSSRPFVIFDFDGTLGDTVSAILATQRDALAEWGMPEGEMGDLNRLVGPPLPEAYSWVYGVSEQEAREITRIYRDMFADAIARGLPCFDGVPEMLGRLRDTGRHLAIATSRLEWQLVEITRQEGILEYFDVALGQVPDVRSHKGEVLSDVIAALGCDASQAVMVGDRCFDVEGAHEHGMPCIGVLYAGTGTREELETAGADVIVETVAGIADVLLGANP